MSNGEFEWGRDQYRNGAHPWEGNLTQAQAEGYRWERWLAENERFQRDQQAQVDAAARAASGSSVWPAASGGATWSSDTYSGADSGGGGGDGSSAVIFGGLAAVWFVVTFWFFILMVVLVAASAVVALYARDILRYRAGLRPIGEVAETAARDFAQAVRTVRVRVADWGVCRCLLAQMRMVDLFVGADARRAALRSAPKPTGAMRRRFGVLMLRWSAIACLWLGGLGCRVGAYALGKVRDCLQPYAR